MQRLSGTDARIARCAALGIVIGLHAVAVILIWKSRDVRLVHTTETHLVWLRLERPVARPVAPVPPPRQEPEVRPREPEPRAAAPVHRSPTQTSPPPNIDWSAQAAYTARKTVEEGVAEERYRNLGPRKPPPKPEPQPPSIFEPEQDVMGKVAEDALGNPVVRLNKHCYQELEDKRNPTDRRGDLSPPPLTKCVFRVGKRKVRGDLFDHLKKERPLPERKPTVKSELPERAPEDAAGSADP